MKLPKRPKVALAGAANALVAEQNSQSSDDDESGDENATNMNLPQINLGSNPDFNANVATSKRCGIFIRVGSHLQCKISKLYIKTSFYILVCHILEIQELHYHATWQN